MLCCIIQRFYFFPRKLCILRKTVERHFPFRTRSWTRLYFFQHDRKVFVKYHTRIEITAICMGKFVKFFSIFLCKNDALCEKLSRDIFRSECRPARACIFFIAIRCVSSGLFGRFFATRGCFLFFSEWTVHFRENCREAVFILNRVLHATVFFSTRSETFYQTPSPTAAHSGIGRTKIIFLWENDAF